MSAPWFYLAELPEVGRVGALDQREARHAVGARRLKQGEVVCLFDGKGNVARSIIQRISNREVIAEVTEVELQSPPKPHVHLAAALPKGDRQAVMLSMATQLSLGAFTPLLCTYGIVKPGGGFRERAERVCLEACKQCRQSHLPVVHHPASVSQVLDDAVRKGERVILAHPGGVPFREVLRELYADDRIVVLIGPEGGFTEEEVEAGQAVRATVVSLGETLLRVETAASAVLAGLRIAFSDR